MKLGRIPDGGGWRTLGCAAGGKHRSSMGYSYLHSAIDDHSRLVYSEILFDERKDTAAGFWHRAQAFYASLGITVQRVMTDNGSCYRSKTFNTALGKSVKHKYTRPYRPQTNGKIERFHRTLADEWAYARHHRLRPGTRRRLPWTAGCFSDSACFVFQAALVKSRKSRSTSLGVRYPRAE